MNIQRDAAPPPKFLHTDSRHPVCIFGRAQTSHHADTAFCGGLFLDQAAKHGKAQLLMPGMLVQRTHLTTLQTLWNHDPKG